MILSKQSMLSDKQAITATAMSTNTIDFGPTGTPYGGAAPFNADMGWGTKIPLLVQVTEDFAGLTSLTVEVMCDDNETPTTTIQSSTLTLAQLTAGAQTSIDVIPQNCKGRYFALKYVVTGAAPSAGAITAGVTMGNQTNVTGA